jgi:hypothetical protein
MFAVDQSHGRQVLELRRGGGLRTIDWLPSHLVEVQLDDSPLHPLRS